MPKPEDDLVEAIVLGARSMTKHSPAMLIPTGYDYKIMISTQEELDGSVSWWIRIMTGSMHPVRSWHAEGQFGLMAAATNASLWVYPWKGKRL